MLRPFAHPVARCCAKFETQTFEVLHMSPLDRDQFMRNFSPVSEIRKGQRSFSHRETKIWNSLDKSLESVKNFKTFKRSLTV